ncbi:MAG: hypothetical protein DHS20C01_19420 [marine bacterium B5-7]|nr:MAG: hypothetical protein DHS20C01_19420 [marine bacterium B5-7]
MKSFKVTYITGVCLLASSFLPAAVSAQNQSANSAIHSLQQTLSTDAYAGILKAMVNPATLKNPVVVCAQCHSDEDAARYSKVLGPMLQMANPLNWVNPMAYVNMATPIMDPETYAEWYKAYTKKYGGLLGYNPDTAAGETTADPETKDPTE